MRSASVFKHGYVVGLGALVAVLAFVAFLPVLDNGFVDWDDEKNFVLNPYFQGWGWTYFRWAWTTFLLGVYQPLAWLLLEAQYFLWQLNPKGYHAASMLLHALNAVLLYALILMLMRRGDPRSCQSFPLASAAAAAAAALLFAVHPLRTEAIAWVSAQAYLPCATFCLLSLLAYLRAVPVQPSAKGTHTGWLLASIGLFAAALLCKAMALGLPLVIIALDAYPLRRLGASPSAWLAADKRAMWMEKLPYIALSLAFALLAVAAKKDPSFTQGLDGPKLSLTLAQFTRSLQAIAFYIEKTILPTGIGPYYSTPAYVDLGAPAVFLSVAFVLVTTAVLWFARRRWPALLVAWVSYIVLLAPTVGVVKYSDQMAADRYSYLPIMGLYVLLAWGLLQLAAYFATWRPAWRRVMTAALLALLIALAAASSVYSWTLSRIWYNSETLWVWADEHGGHSVAEVQNYLGQARLKAGQTDDARQRFAEAIRLRPDYADAYSNLAVVWANAGDFARAEAGFRKALGINPAHLHARPNLALALQRQGRMSEAVGEYGALLRTDPGNQQLQHQLHSANSHRLVSPRVAAAAKRVLLHPDDPAAHAALVEAVKRVVAEQT